MTLHGRRFLLRANAVFLTVMSLVGLLIDIAGIFFSKGPQSRILQSGPDGSLPVAGIGFVEAHGLALILGITLWRVPASRSWHLTAAAIHLLLGTANLTFWGIFVGSQMLALGYLSTILHGVFMALQLGAAVASGPASSASSVARDDRH